MSFGEASSSPRITHTQPHTGIAAGLSTLQYHSCSQPMQRARPTQIMARPTAPCHGWCTACQSLKPRHTRLRLYSCLRCSLGSIKINLGAISVSSMSRRGRVPLLCSDFPAALSSAPTHWARSPHQLFPANSSTPPSPGLNHAHESRSPSPSIRQGCSIDDHFAQRPGAACGKHAARALHSFVCVC